MKKLADTRRSILSAALGFLAIGLICSKAAPVVVTSAGISTSDNTDWVTDGLATLNGALSGVNWQSGAAQGGGGADWVFAGGYSQGQLSSPTVEWVTSGSFSPFGYVVDTVNLDIGTTMASDVVASGGSILTIAEVAPSAGDFTLNGITQTATATGQVLLWSTPAADLVVGDVLTFTSTGSYNAGPIGFSTVASVPEPSTWALTFIGLSGLALGQILRRRSSLID